MSNIIEAEYKVIQERTLPVIASEILQIEENVGRVALDGAIRIGEKLKEAKEQVEHGQWESWCQDNLNYSKSKTEKLMKIAAEYGNENSVYAKTYTCTDLSISKALRLLQVPEDEVESFAENNNVSEMTVKELEAEIKALKEEKADAEALKKESIRMKQELDDLKAAGAKQKEKNKKLSDDLKAEKEGKEEEVRKALDKEKERLQQEAEAAAEKQLQQAWKENEQLSREIDQLSRKIENSSNENTLTFKLRVDQLQEVFEECKSCIDAEADQETERRMRAALGTVINTLKGKIREE